VVLIQIPFVAGLALAFAALNVHFKDVRDILTNLLNLLFFMTPILYTLETVRPFPLVYALVAYNPFTPFVTAYQDLLFYGRCPGLGGWLLLVAISATVFALGAGLFERLEDTLVEAV
jgi:lipopolysaccharide transport system permease protein